jgi:hypothetical protein
VDEIRLGFSANFFSSTGSAETCKEEAAWACTEGTTGTREEEEDTGEEFNSNRPTRRRNPEKLPKPPEATTPVPEEEDDRTQKNLMTPYPYPQKIL